MLTGAGNISEISVSPSEFCYEPKTTLKKLSYLQRKDRPYIYI